MTSVGAPLEARNRRGGLAGRFARSIGTTLPGAVRVAFGAPRPRAPPRSPRRFSATRRRRRPRVRHQIPTRDWSRVVANGPQRSESGDSGAPSGAISVGDFGQTAIRSPLSSCASLQASLRACCCPQQAVTVVPRLNEDESRTFHDLQRLEQGKMQELGDLLLSWMYPSLGRLVPRGKSLEGKTTKGVPDSFVGETPQVHRRGGIHNPGGKPPKEVRGGLSRRPEELRRCLRRLSLYEPRSRRHRRLCCR